MRNATRLRALVGGSIAALGVFTVGAGLALVAGISTASAAGGIDKKDYVCKYVGTPGVDERLQTGNNPIWVATDFPEGGFFNDANGRSFVLIADTARLNPEPDPSACPDATGGVTDPTEAADPETDTVDPETEAVDPETEAVDPETEAADPETEAAEPETEAVVPETEAVEPETEAGEPETEAGEPETEAGEPETDEGDSETDTDPETDPAGTSIVVPGDHSNSTVTPETETDTVTVTVADTLTETETSTPSENGFAEPRPVAVPTSVAAGLSRSGDGHGGLGQLFGLLGALMSVGGVVVTVTGRTRGAHQL